MELAAEVRLDEGVVNARPQELAVGVKSQGLAARVMSEEPAAVLDLPEVSAAAAAAGSQEAVVAIASGSDEEWTGSKGDNAATSWSLTQRWEAQAAPRGNSEKIVQWCTQAARGVQGAACGWGLEIVPSLRHLPLRAARNASKAAHTAPQCQQ